MVGMSTVLEYPYPQRASPDRFSLGQVDYFNGHKGTLASWSESAAFPLQVSKRDLKANRDGRLER